MTRSIRGTRRAMLLLAGMGAATTLLVSGCGAGQIAQTASKVPSVPGVNLDSRDGAVSIRNLIVAYGGVKGYPAGGDAPLAVALFNNSETPVTVRVTTTAPAAGAPEDMVVSGRSVVLAGKTAPTSAPSATKAASPTASASPSPTASAPASGSASPTTPSPSASAEAPAGTPAVVEIPAKGSVIFTAESSELLKVVGLSAPLTFGRSVNLTFAFSSNNEQLTVTAPIGVPLTPAPRATPEQNEGGEGR